MVNLHADIFYMLKNGYSTLKIVNFTIKGHKDATRKRKDSSQKLNRRNRNSLVRMHECKEMQLAPEKLKQKKCRLNDMVYIDKNLEEVS